MENDISKPREKGLLTTSLRSVADSDVEFTKPDDLESLGTGDCDGEGGRTSSAQMKCVDFSESSSNLVTSDVNIVPSNVRQLHVA